MRSPAAQVRRAPALMCLSALAALLVTTAPPASTVSTAAPHASSHAVAPDVRDATPRRSSRFPNADTTGVTSSRLIAVPGQQTSGPGWRWDGSKVVVTRNGARIRRLDINGALLNEKQDAVIKNTRIRCTNEESWCVTLGSGSTLRDSEVGGGEDGATFQPSIGILSGSYESGQAANLVLRVNIHHTVHGMRIDGDTTVLDSYLHDFPMGDPGWEDAHSDGIMCTAGANVVIDHNTFASGNTAPFFVQWQEGNVEISSYRVQHNLFVGVERNGQMSTYGVMFENQGIAGAPIIRNNRFKGEFEAGHILAPRGSIITGNRTVTGGRAKVELQ